MTLSLDDVRNMRFRMARKSGYEVLEVDEFVDQVEETFAQLIEENQNLKRQVESLKSSAPAVPQAAPVYQAEQGEPSGGGPIVVTTSKEASAAVVRLVELSANQAEQLVAEAKEEADRIKEEADRAAHQVTTDARTRAERVESEARVSAERLQADALGRSEQLDQEIANRRRDMFSDLERQRDELSQAVADLRQFEAAFRTNLTQQLQGHLDEIRQGRAEPDEVPELAHADQDRPAEEQGAGPDEHRDDAPTLGGGSPGSNTPRLDALLGEQH
ncbi:DivIVA domain-containing protein [Microlunatus panaciterrae]|uniref:Cell wall synthesis protein Wag31 n=1 Tax=Microlunatus panaciterrae TaxID=400768 RepID=A0ABS2RP07_9ACTN|nr:DivIVA domain-containing protein [Microlunatus panaciterrae]MBM7800212.1 DivIVA domain-containing protein [Microlunatus panaciterrae]